MSDEQRQSGSDPDASVPGGSGPVDRSSAGPAERASAEGTRGGPESAAVPGVDGVGDGPTVDLAAVRRSVGGGERPVVDAGVVDDDPRRSRSRRPVVRCGVCRFGRVGVVRV